jgi:streptogramin lyase
VKNIVSFLLAMLILTAIMQSFSVIRFSYANLETILYVSPFTTTVHTGDIFSVNVSIQDILDLYAFHSFLGYNTTVLDALSVYIYPPFNGGPIITIIDDANGYVEFSGSVGIPGLGVSGSFPLAKITFNATALGNSKLDLYNTDLRDSMSNSITHSVVDGEVLIYPYITGSEFVLEVAQVQCEISRESGVTYFKLPTWSLFGPNMPVYDYARQAVWMTSTNITYDNWGNIEMNNGVMIMLNITSGSALLYKFPLDVGEGFKGLAPSSCTLDTNGNLWIAICGCFWIPEEPSESIPSLARLCPENNTLTVFWLPEEFGWVNDVKFYEGFVWCLSDKYLIKMSGDNLAGFWKISDTPSFGCVYPDGDYIWITRYDTNEVKRFNRLTETFDVSFADINKPLGIYGDSNHIFVAESDGNFIMVVNKESLTFSRISINNKPTYLCITDRGNLWWTGINSSIGVLGKIYNHTYSIKCGPSGPITMGLNNTIVFSGRKYAYHLGPPYITCDLYTCVRGNIRSPDINNDGIVDGKDISLVCRNFGMTFGRQDYNPNTDINNDEIVDGTDVSLVCRNFGREDP